MKLYDNPFGSNPKRVRMYLAEKGLDIPTQLVDFQKEEHRTPAFRKINPMAALPVLELDDGTILTESMAICRYLEELHPEPPLMGTTPLERAQIEMWNRRMELDVTNYIPTILKHTNEFFKNALTQVPEIAEASRIDMMKKLDWLNEELATRDYIAGNTFTIADISAYARFGMRKMAGVDFADHHTNLNAWWDRIDARPSAEA